jgi:hypothetical protein
MSQLPSFSFALRVGKGGSHGFRGLDWEEDGAFAGAVVPLGGGFVPSVVGRWWLSLLPTSGEVRGVCAFVALTRCWR